ncbi:hypothetical protein DFJ74DRAFT_602620 [Hyaloraphidium curvatum]|nr:hypothetical protein DFJ74DRAFT_602620 [Hyaloraphidium curvatum]
MNALEKLAEVLEEDGFHPISGEDASQVTFRASLAYIRSLTPVVFRGLCSDWPALQRPEWRSLRGLASLYRGAVPIVSSRAGEGYGNETRTQLDAHEWASRVESDPEDTSYLKDFHPLLHNPCDDSYTVPAIFADDYLNAFNDARTLEQSRGVVDDYRFVYASNAGGRTPLHVDVLKSHSWSANVEGWKLWLFFDDEAIRPFCSANGDLMVSDGATDRQRCAINDAIAGLAIDPNLRFEHRTRDAKHLHTAYCIQGPKDIVFVPSGLHHQVVNLSSPTISINTNWFGGMALGRVWDFLNSELAAVRAAIADVGLEGQDFEDHCQLLLKAQTGFDYDDFGALLLCNARRLLSSNRRSPGLVSGNIDQPLSSLPPSDPHVAPLVRHPEEIEDESKAQLVAVIEAFLQDPYMQFHAAGDRGREASRGPSKPPRETEEMLLEKLARLHAMYGYPPLDRWRVEDLAGFV